MAELKCCSGRNKIHAIVFLFSRAVVTEEELALALVEGEEITTPPPTTQNQLSTNGLTDVETENDPLNYSMEETK